MSPGRREALHRHCEESAHSWADDEAISLTRFIIARMRLLRFRLR